MTTPKIEELIARLHERAKFLGPELTLAILPEAAHAMQSQAERIAELELDIDVQAGSIEAVQAVNARQAERIAELERESETHSKAYGLAIVERDNLRHELKVAQEGWRCESAGMKPLFTCPMPAQDVNAELVEALEALIESTTGVDQVSVVNDARTALSKYKGAK